MRLAIVDSRKIIYHSPYYSTYKTKRDLVLGFVNPGSAFTDGTEYSTASSDSFPFLAAPTNRK
jgi:hypothetical protein